MDKFFPEISVVVPTYNNEKYIIQCLESIRHDKPNRIELIVIDDGSTDDSIKLIQNWISKNSLFFFNVIFKSQQNKGITKTLNRLVELSTCDYVAILAGDDCLLPGGLDARINALKENISWLGVFGDCEVIDENNHRIFESGIELLYPKRVSARKVALLSPQSITLELILRWSIPGPVFMAKRIAYSEEFGVGKYNERLKTEDRDFYLRLIAKKALGFINTKVAAYRIHDSSTVNILTSKKTVQESVIESEKLNLMNFTGLNRLALYSVMQYRVGVILLKHSSNTTKRIAGIFLAMIFYMIKKVVDLYQSIIILLVKQRN